MMADYKMEAENQQAVIVKAKELWKKIHPKAPDGVTLNLPMNFQTFAQALYEFKIFITKTIEKKSGNK